MTKFIQRRDCEDFEIPLGEIYKISCCDCGLVHDMVFIIEDGKLIVAARRNNKSTGQRRRNNNYSYMKDIAEGVKMSKPKIIKVVLMDCGISAPKNMEYKVIELHNTAEFRVHKYLSRRKVINLCKRENCTIIIKEK